MVLKWPANILKKPNGKTRLQQQRQPAAAAAIASRYRP